MRPEIPVRIYGNFYHYPEFPHKENFRTIYPRFESSGIVEWKAPVTLVKQNVVTSIDIVSAVVFSTMIGTYFLMRILPASVLVFRGQARC